MVKSTQTEENELVCLKIRAEDGNTYECVGVLLSDDRESMCVAFNAHNDIAKDYIDVPKADIFYREKIDMSSVEVIR
ncbi:MAG: hypothetical protein WDZ75_01540 [Candidatus Paceibacterota bacterium]